MGSEAAMKKGRWVVLILVMGLVALAAAPSPAWAHWRGGVFIGVGPWWGPAYPYWWYPPPYYPYYYPAPTVIIEQPPVYVEQPTPPPAPPAPPAYWYYCSSGKEYYPTIQTCPEDWVKVPPRPQ
jgi:hypothetical protein